VADDESDIEHINSIEDPKCLELLDVSAVPNVTGLVRPSCKSKRQVEKEFVKVNEIDTRCYIEV